MIYSQPIPSVSQPWQKASDKPVTAAIALRPCYSHHMLQLRDLQIVSVAWMTHVLMMILAQCRNTLYI